MPPEITSISKKVRWTSYVMSALPSLMLIFSATMKLVQPAGFAESVAHLQLPLSAVIGIGILELTCTAIYLIPRTAVLGAILLTGYLGGAMLTHLRIGEPYFMHVIFGVFLWGGLYLREPRLRALIPLRK